MAAVTTVTDEDAFRALVAPHRRALEVHCYRMLGSVHDAEDVLQEALLRAWRAFGRFEGRSSIHTWLYRIATNACLDELERRPRRPEPAVDPYPDERLADAGPIADPAARYAEHEGMELAFLTTIQRLPGRQRAVLLLRDVLGWSAADSGALLDMSVAAVNSALQRARATLDAALPAASPRPGRARERELLARYVDAWDRADVDGLLAVLREDAVITMPPGLEVRGAADIIAFFVDRDLFATMRLVPTSANGRPALVLVERGAPRGALPHRVILVDADQDGIGGLAAYRDERALAPFADVA